MFINFRNKIHIFLNLIRKSEDFIKFLFDIYLLPLYNFKKQSITKNIDMLKSITQIYKIIILKLV